MKFKFYFIIYFLIIISNVFSQDIKKLDSLEVESLDFEIDGERSSLEYRLLFNTHISPIGIITFLNQNVYSKIGAPPEYFNQLIFKEDISRLKRYLHDKGYFYSIVDTNIKYDFKNKEIYLFVKILEGKRSFIDSATYEGIDSIDENVKNIIYSESLFKNKTPFDKTTIENEKKRILSLFINSGYRFCQIDSITITRFTSGKDLNVRFLISPDKKYYFGNYEIINENKEINQKTVIRQIEFETGDLFEEEKRYQSELNLNNLGVFQNAQIQIQNPTLDSNEINIIPLKILLTATNLRNIEPEIIINDEHSVLNTGFGIGYIDKNFIGEARKFSTNLRFLLHSIQELDFKSAIKNGIKEPTLLTKSNLNFNLNQPYFFSNKNTSSISLAAEYEKQKLYTLTTLRNKFGVTSKLAKYTFAFFDWYIERINIEQYDEKINISSLTGNRQKQFNSIFSLTLQRDKTNNLFSPTEGFFHSISFEESGILPRAFKEFTQGLPYSEYFKYYFNIKNYYDFSISQSKILALRFRGGSAILYNNKNQTPVPLNRRFYLGGSNSMRSWRSRSLSTFENPELGGNTSFEFSTEYRYHFANEKDKLSGFEVTKIWGVVFLDFGNLWNKVADINFNEIAISGGVGFRYDTMVGPIRLDFAWRIYDPQKNENKWISKQKFFKESFNIVQIGIGHAF